MYKFVECPYNIDDVWYGSINKYIMSNLSTGQGNQGDVSSHEISNSNKAAKPLPHKMNGHAKHVFRCNEVRVRSPKLFWSQGDGKDKWPIKPGLLLVQNRSKHQHAYTIRKLTAQCGALGTRPPMHGCTVNQVSTMTAVYALANPHG